MRLPTSSGKQKRPKALIIRRVNGDSMLPALKPGRLILASSLIGLKTNRVVIVRRGNIEIVKRLKEMSGAKAYITGDNALESTDSRDFGWISKSDILATVIWPRKT